MRHETTVGLRRTRHDSVAGRGGFTTMEMLIAVAILVITFALVAPNLISAQRSLRQKELDTKAEIIYVAVQNQLVKLRASGHANSYAMDKNYQLLVRAADTGTEAQVGLGIPNDMQPQYDEEGRLIQNLHFVSRLNSSPPNEQATAIMTEKTVDPELLGNHWIIEYDPTNCNVFSVFYSETKNLESEYATKWAEYNQYRERTNDAHTGRFDKGAWVGYYGGDVASSTKTTSQLVPTMTVTNAEKLTVNMRCVNTTGLMLGQLNFRLEITDAEGNHWYKNYKVSAFGTLYRLGPITLDDLSSEDTRFKNLFNGLNLTNYGVMNLGSQALTPGSKLTLRLTVSSTNSSVEDGTFGPVYTNSLYADSSTTDTAHIEYGRHLQNLDETAFGTSFDSTHITKAEQRSDVSFKDDNDNSDDWYTYYSNNFFNGIANNTANFKPINNQKLQKYDGKSYRIAGLNVSASTNAALFEQFQGGTELKDIRLTGSRVRATAEDGCAAALVGAVSTTGSAKNTINGCYAYLEPADYRDKDNKYIWIQGATAGGLVGKAKSGTLEITNSLASSVIDGSSYTGGIVGQAENGVSVSMDTSYADSYLTGSVVGGLAVGDVSKIANCYVAGFQTAIISVAGLVNGTITDCSASYTISAMEEKEDQNSSDFVLYSTAKPSTTINKVYYFTPSNKAEFDISGTTPIGTMSNRALADALNEGGSTKFTYSNAGYTSPYRLMGQSLPSAYTYPRLNDIRHYGDWKTEFEPGALVYYEKYKDGTYGFDGAGINETTLKDDSTAVIGDGYGLVYKASDSMPTTITVKVGTFGDYTINTSGAPYYSVSGVNGVEYHIYPLPTNYIDNDLASEGTGYSTSSFFQKVEVTTSDDGSESSYFYFNPYFAKMAMRSSKDEEAPTLSEGQEVFIRTPRHLYALSLYYDQYYRGLTNQNTFVQERGLNYSEYEWVNYSTRIPANSEVTTINAQGPIGTTLGTGFVAEYDGGCNIIEDVSFQTNDGSYVGMFGYSAGSVHDVVLATQYDAAHPEKQFLVKRFNNMRQNDVVCMGVLVGCNAGHMENCAIAGYYIAGSDGTIHTYANSALYAGGLVGRNEGVIRNCSVDSPAIRLSSLYSEVMLGGFVGWNTGSGSIVDCYALGYLEVAESRGGTGVNASGFAGFNDGSITSSYCATAIVTNGEAATSYGFAPGTAADLQISDCFYMDRGTYFYVSSLRSYNNVTARTAATPFVYDLDSIVGGTPLMGTKVDASHSKYHANTIIGEGEPDAYPFRAVVTDADGTPVHYGDWMNGPAMGDVGIFYWEHEEGGSNSGYHITYVGTAEEGKDSGTSLCTAHDDGGRITDFGYGYYVRAGQEENAKITAAQGIASSVAINDGPGTYNQTVSAALHEQMDRYTFYPYTTRMPDNASGEDYVYLDCTGDSNYDRRSGTWTISIVREGSLNAVDYTYQITPFFANAICLQGAQSSIPVTASDGRATDYALVSGVSANNSGGNPYEIRTVQQFQYINWNHATKNCDTLVYGKKNNANSGNFKQFPFLQYATVLKMGVQDRASVESLRPPQNWVQSHDLLGASGEGKEVLTPIAGMATSTPVTDGTNENYLYAWFGGNYDGQSYKIQNVSVVSEAYTVGLFGATAGAGIKNVILYANDYNEETGEGSRIERNTANITRSFGTDTVDFEVGPGAYNLGGMVGIAYEYKSSNITNKIENCAIAGYHVIDHSTNQQGAGTANIGGLVGLANVNLERCSSVTDIVIDSTHEHGHMAWGSYIRVGGLAGSAGAPEATIAVSDCYTGGKVTVSERTLEETPPKYDGDGYAIRDQKINNVSTGLSTNIFVSGMIGGAYSPNISNFTNKNSNAPDGVATISNCYTYLELPNLEGTVRAVSLFASQADRYYRKSQITLNNCYYLSSIKDGIRHPNPEDPSTWPKYFFAASKSRINNAKAPSEADRNKMLEEHDQATIDKYKGLVITEEEFEQMLDGDLTCLNELLNKQINGDSVKKVLGSPAQGITYNDLSSEGAGVLNGTRGTNGPWSKVTTRDQSGADISGKYSFSSDDSQEGKDYPFSTVIQQKDITYSTATQTSYVYVHYGRWPLSDWRWSKGRDSMDIFDDMGDDGYATKEFILKYKEQPSDQLTVDSFTVYPADKARVVEVVPDPNNSCYRVKVRAMRDGYVTISENVSGTSASFVLDITAKLKLQSDPNRLVLYNGKPSGITFTARSHSGTRDYSTTATMGNNPWTLAVVEPTDVDHFLFEVGSEFSEWQVTSDTIGSHSIMATYTYDYHSAEGGKTYTERLNVPTRTMGCVGLSNGDTSTSGDESAFNSSRAYRRATTEGVVVEQVNLGMSLPSASQLFLFASAEDEDLESFTIGEDIAVEPVDSNATINANDYMVVFSSKPLSGMVKDTVTGGSYRRWAGYVRYVGTEEPMPIRVTVPVTDPVSGVTYVLTTVVTDIPNRIVHFEKGADDAVGSVEDVALLTSDPYFAPECGYTKIGYTFDGWEIEGEEGTKYQVGEELPIEGFTTVVATWRPNTYTLSFDANGGTEMPDKPMEDLTLTYDVSAALPANTFQPAEGYTFVEWNTKANGSGVAFSDGQDVENLTDVDGDTLVLYAQWRLTRKLNLNAYDAVTTRWESSEYVGVSGSSVGTDYVRPEATGWTLDGWYTGVEADDLKVLDATGTITDDSVVDAQSGTVYVRDGEFVYDDELTLYARWSRADCYIQVDKLEHVADDEGNYHDDGIYLIASDNTASPKLMSLNGTSFTNTAAQVNNVAVCDYSGQAIGSALIAESINDNARWQFTYRKSQPDTDYYSIETLTSINDKYLRDNNGNPQMTNTIMYNSGYNNKQMWTYGMKNPFQMQSEFHLYDNNAANKCLYWTGSTWKTNATNKTAYLYKQYDEVYTYYPKALSD